jgi:hypothetical protein
MRSAAIAFAAVFLVGLAAVAAVAATQRSDLEYSLGVKPALEAVRVPRGTEACQAPVRPPTGTTFDRVGFMLTTPAPPGPPVRVTVREAGTERELGSGRLPGGYGDWDPLDPREHVVDVGLVRTGAPLELCLENTGSKPVGVIGQAGIASPPTAATLNGNPLDNDITFNLRSGEESTLAALLPQIAERASRFRAGWVSPIVYLMLAIGILIVGPLLLARGLARADAADRPLGGRERGAEALDRAP